jgi:hypothetical protein
MPRLSSLVQAALLLGALLGVPGGCTDGLDVVCGADESQCACIPLPSVRSAAASDACDNTNDEAFCCADSVYPKMGTCTCTRARCVKTADGSCSCSATSDQTLEDTTCPASPDCCSLADGSCACGPKMATCPEGATHVKSCAVAEMRCLTGDPVRSCSAP